MSREVRRCDTCQHWGGTSKDEEFSCNLDLVPGEHGIELYSADGYSSVDMVTKADFFCAAWIEK